MKNIPRLLFIGTPAYVLPILDGLFQQSQKGMWILVGAVTQPDKKVGRNQQLTQTAVKQYTVNHKILCLAPEKIGDPNAINAIMDLKPDLIISADYAQKIPPEIFDFPRFKSLNFHPSLLPAYRGVSPAQSAIRNGEKETGLTVFITEKDFDSGPVVFQKKIPILSLDTADSLYTRIFSEAALHLPTIINGFIDGTLKPQPQNSDLATYSQKLNRESGLIDWQKPDINIERMIRAFHPWPGTWTLWQGKRLKILKAHLDAECKLVLDEIQLEGKKPLKVADFCRGCPDFSIATLRKKR